MTTNDFEAINDKIFTVTNNIEKISDIKLNFCHYFLC